MSLGDYIGSGSAVTLGLYRLRNDSNDDSGNAANGTDTSITYDGDSAEFNGSSSGIAIPVNVTGAMTVFGEMWIDPSYTNSERWIIARDSGIAVSGNQFNLGLNGAGRLRRAVNRTVGERHALYGNYGTEFTHSTWYFVVAIWNGSNQLDIYIDGAYAGGATVSTGTQASFTQTYIGRRGNGGHRLGKLRGRGVENRAWSAKEVGRQHAFLRGRYVF